MLRTDKASFAADRSDYTHFLGAVAAYGARGTRLVHRSRMRTADIRNGALHLLYCGGDTLDSYWRTVGLRSDAMMGGRPVYVVQDGGGAMGMVRCVWITDTSWTSRRFGVVKLVA